MKKVYIFLAEGFEEVEALTVVDLLRRVDIPIEMVSITKEKTVVSARKIPVIADVLLSEIDFQLTEMLILPGGMPGTTNLEACELLMQNIKNCYEEGKKIAAICAAPSILGKLGILKGKKACVFPGFEKDLLGATVTTNEVEVDGNIITSRAMGTAIAFGLAIVTSLKGQEVAVELSKKIVYGKSF